MSEISPKSVLAKSTIQAGTDMAKIQLKSDNINPFGGLFSILNIFNRGGLRSVIDRPLGRRGMTKASFSHGDVFASMFGSYLSGGDRIEDMMEIKPFWDDRDNIRVCSSDVHPPDAAEPLRGQHLLREQPEEVLRLQREREDELAASEVSRSHGTAKTPETASILTLTTCSSPRTRRTRSIPTRKTEQSRGSDLGLTEEDPEIFDLLSANRKLTKVEERKVILASKNLYQKLQEDKDKIMVVDWYKDAQPRQKVLSIIQTSLNKDLPDSYNRAIFNDKTNTLFNHFVDMAAQGYGWIA